MTTTLLVDGTNLTHRASYAAQASQSQMSVDGVNTAPLVIFAGLLSKYVRLVKPTHMALFWDAGHDFRDALYPEYKAARRKPTTEDLDTGSGFVLAKEFLTWSGVPHKAHKGYEADDLIAATARQTLGKTVILSGDKDLLQLVTPRQAAGGVDQWREVTQIRIPDEEEWTERHVEEKFGVPPHHLASYLGLVGDAGDGVPGVAGIGPKKALALLEKAEWDWDVVLTLLGPEKAQQAVLMRQLVDLRTYPYDEIFMQTNTGAPAFSPAGPGSGLAWEMLDDFCATYRLNSLRERLVAGTLWADPTSDEDVFANFETSV